MQIFNIKDFSTVGTESIFKINRFLRH